jgi:sugar phosphate isomerase/epimerase
MRTHDRAIQSRRGWSRRKFLAASVAAAGGWSTLGEAAPPARPFHPRFAICNEIFEAWPFEKAFAFAAECGYQGIELAPFTVAHDVRTISAAKRKEIRRQAERAGLEIFGLHWLLAKTEGFHLTSPDAQVRRNTADYLAALADFCADLGGNLLIFGSPQQRSLAPGMPKTTGLTHATEIIHAALPTLEKRNVTLTLEPLSPKSTNFLSTAAEAVELIEKAASPRCRLVLDCLAMSTESTPIPDLLRRHRDRLVHVQVNDPNRQGPGFGELDFRPILAALRAIGYAGWLSVEVFDFTPGPERLARESIAYLKACLR